MHCINTANVEVFKNLIQKETASLPPLLTMQTTRYTRKLTVNAANNATEKTKQLSDLAVNNYTWTDMGIILKTSNVHGIVQKSSNATYET